MNFGPDFVGVRLIFLPEGVSSEKSINLLCTNQYFLKNLEPYDTTDTSPLVLSPHTTIHQ